MTLHEFSIILNDGTVYELSQPMWLWLIPAVIIIKLISMVYFSETSSNLTSTLYKPYSNAQYYHPLIEKFSHNNSKEKTNTSSHAFLIILFFLIVFAMSQPVKIGEKRPNPPQERDIIFIVDTSVSMILRDYILDGKRISRMDLLKAVLDNFIQELHGERMSIIVFGDNAYTLVPLTTDQYLLRTMLSRVQATMAGRFNAMGAGISLAVKQAVSQQDKPNTRKRVLVLLTDADQPTGDVDPITAAQLAKAYNLPLYTIAIGSTSKNAEEKRQGGLLYSPVDLDLVKKISKITHAEYFQAGDPDALDDAIAAINQHETNTREIEPLYFKEPFYFWFLIAAATLFISQQILIFLISTFDLSNKGKN